LIPNSKLTSIEIETGNGKLTSDFITEQFEEELESGEVIGVSFSSLQKNVKLLLKEEFYD
jgi:hypothetical protein